jgi:hypothetical protein
VHGGGGKGGLFAAIKHNIYLAGTSCTIYSKMQKINISLKKNPLTNLVAKCIFSIQLLTNSVLQKNVKACFKIALILIMFDNS